VTDPHTDETGAGRVLVVDDEHWLAVGLARILERHGISALVANSVDEALKVIGEEQIDAVITDIDMPGRSGLDLLKELRGLDPALPVMIVTGIPNAESAAEAIEYGVYKYLAKPFDAQEVVSSTLRAISMRKVAVARVDVSAIRQPEETPRSVRTAETTEELDLALSQIWLAYQPVVKGDGLHSIFGYEVLLRCEYEKWARPDLLISAAETKGRLLSLERRIREMAAARPPGDDGVLFLNLHPSSLNDPTLVDPNSTLASFADRVVLEVTETASLGDPAVLRDTLRRLREIGYRVALDDLGSGFASLNNLFSLEPDIVKLDMALVRSIDVEPQKRNLVAAVVQACVQMGVKVVAEGIETRGEFDCMVDLGCDLFQGFWIARPAREMTSPPTPPGVEVRAGKFAI
jgi:EAL domain-containing protein (putative c-di-GMP-specific phosphodiesterase class I)/AmiR/NasT family two-component response regulator